ncbi:MAG: glycosyltransferase [Eggerthellaceae bacterium]|nr:glycosyltransferase [Eggerthellaceae bacterium]
MPDLTHDTVSVIVPIFNVEKYLDQALDSLEAQTYPNLEIICVNDGSTDSSLDIIKRHAEADSRYVVIDKKNAGYGSGCNCGMDHATGEWIAILEPDDWLEAGMFADMLSFGSRFEEIPDIIKTPYVRIWLPDTQEQKRYECSYRGRVKPAKQPFTVEEAPHLVRHHPSIWSAIYRKSFLEEFGIRFHEIPGAGWADNPFLMDTLLRARRIVYLDKAYYCYRETTPEKEAAAFRKNPALPFDRWQDMTDIMEELHVTDPGLVKMHIDKGFMYRDSVIANNDPDVPAILEMEKKMFDRMDPAAVFADPSISPGKKARFATVRSIDCPKQSSLPYWWTMFKEVCYNVKNNGVSYTADIVDKALHKFKA